jgi:hypothetical protein
MKGVNRSSRSTPAEDDGVDQIGYDTPRSGVATPQPDLHDKRLPGIMSYFNQVRSSSFQRFLPGSFRASGQTATITAPPTPEVDISSQIRPAPQLPLSPVESASRSASLDQGARLLPQEMPGLGVETLPLTGDQLHPYPTPPTSQRSSLRNYQGDSSSQKSRGGTPPVSRPVSLRNSSVSDLSKSKARRSSLLAPLTSAVEASVPSRHLSNPARRPSTVPNSPSRPRFTSGVEDVCFGFASILQLKKLTDTSAQKSGTSTPTRALSSSGPPRSGSQEDTNRENGERIDRTATHTPTPPGAQAPAAKGKLTIKISEARDVRMCRDPYVVVVFQRSELISGPPRPSDNDDEAAIAAVATGGLPIQRQGSDSGRPAMAIPMRSRQSSNTSIHDYTTFRNRNSRRSFTNPKWDAEAIL